MPFRDAGYSQADYSLTIQDVVYGVWKAKEEALVGLKESRESTRVTSTGSHLISSHSPAHNTGRQL